MKTAPLAFITAFLPRKGEFSNVFLFSKLVALLEKILLVKLFKHSY